MAKHHHHEDGHHKHHATGGPIEMPGHEHTAHLKHGGHAGHKGHHHGKKHRAMGGRTEEWVSGNPDVKREAEDKHGTEKKHGGRMHKKHGGSAKHHHGKHHKATGGAVTLGLMTGGGVRPRLDKPGRKMGGRVGADKSPLSSAHAGNGGGEGSSNPRDTYGGTPS
jgi:hypothetical protein